MNISVLGVMPWRELASHSADQDDYVISVFMQQIYGTWAGRAHRRAHHLDGLRLGILAAARILARALRRRARRQLLSRFANVHPKRRFPTVSLLALGGVAALFCFLRLADVIAALVVIRILLQFIVQAVGLIVLRRRRPEMPRPFRMWLYPLPALLAIAGFLFILVSRKNFQREIRYAVAILIVGLIVYFLRSWRRREWPFAIPQRTV